MKTSLTSFDTPRRLLKSLGLWRDENSSTLVRGVMLHLMFIDIPLLLQLIYIFKLNDVAELSDLLKMCLTYVALVLKSINFVWKFGGISMLEELLWDLMKLSTCEWRCRIDKLAPYVQRIRRIFYCCGFRA